MSSWFLPRKKRGYNPELEDPYGLGVYSVSENWMATDKYGRCLYYVGGAYEKRPSEKDDPHIAYIVCDLEMIAIINPDGSFNEETFMVELADKADYQEQLRELKEVNLWNQPFEGGKTQ